MDEITILFNNWFRDHSKSHWCFEGVDALILLKRCRESFNYGFSLNQEDLTKAKQRIKDAEEVIEFYAEAKGNCDTDKEYQPSGFIEYKIGKKAREYFKKYGGGCE